MSLHVVLREELLLLCFCGLCSVSLPHGAVGLSSICDCGTLPVNNNFKLILQLH